MPTTVEIKDQGVSIDFPDSMSQDDIQGVLRRKFGKQQTQTGSVPATVNPDVTPDNYVSSDEERAPAAIAPPSFTPEQQQEWASRRKELDALPEGSSGDFSQLDPKLFEEPTHVEDAAIDLANRPMINIGPAAAEEMRKATLQDPNRKRAAIEAGVAGSVGDMASFFTSPLGIATLGMGALPKLTQRVIALAFAGQMAKDVPGMATELGNELGKPEAERDYKKIAQLTTSGIAQTAFTVGGVMHGAGHPLIEATGAVPLMKAAETIKPVAPLTAAALEQQATAVQSKPESLPAGKNAVSGEAKAAEGWTSIPSNEPSPLPGDIKSLQSKWKDAGVFVHITHNDGGLQLGQIEVPKDNRGKGVGGKVLDDVKKLADERQQPVTLTAMADPGMQQNLERFYESNGFVKYGNDPLNGKPLFRYDPKPASASVPLMITRAMEAELRSRGLSQEQINKLTPQEANDFLSRAPEKGTENAIPKRGSASVDVGEPPGDSGEVGAPGAEQRVAETQGAAEEVAPPEEAVTGASQSLAAEAAPQQPTVAEPQSATISRENTLDLGGGFRALIDARSGSVVYENPRGEQVGRLETGEGPNGELMVENHSLDDEARGHAFGQKAIAKLSELTGKTIISDEHPSSAARNMWDRLGAKRERITLGQPGFEEEQMRYVLRPREKPPMEEPVTGAGQETVREAAVRMPDGAVFTGTIHAEALEKANRAGYTDAKGIESGFVTTKGKFIDPDKAYDLAVSSGAIEPKQYKQLEHDAWGPEGFGDGLEAATFEEAKAKKDLGDESLSKEASPSESVPEAGAPPVPESPSVEAAPKTDLGAAPAEKPTKQDYSDWQNRPQLMVRVGGSHRLIKRQYDAFKNAGVPIRSGGAYTLGSKAQSAFIPDSAEAIALLKEVGGTISRGKQFEHLKKGEPYRETTDAKGRSAERQKFLDEMHAKIKEATKTEGMLPKPTETPATAAEPVETRLRQALEEAEAALTKSGLPTHVRYADTVANTRGMMRAGGARPSADAMELRIKELQAAKDYFDKNSTTPATAAAKVEAPEVGDDVTWKTGDGRKGRASIQSIRKLPNDAEPMADVDYFGPKRVPVSQLEMVKKSIVRQNREYAAARAAETPASAVKKVEREVKSVARTEGQRPAKEVKSELVARIEDEIKAVVDKKGWTVNQNKEYPQRWELKATDGDSIAVDIEKTKSGYSGTVYGVSGGKKTITGKTVEEIISDSKALGSSQSGTVTIDIPGDGEFTVPRNGGSLVELRDRAARISTSKGGSTAASSSHAVTEAEPVIGAYGGAEVAYKSVQRQIKALQDQGPPSTAAEREDWNRQISGANRMLSDIYDKTKAAALEAKADNARTTAATYREGAKGFQESIAKIEKVKKQTKAHKERLEDLQKRYAENQKRLVEYERNAEQFEQEAAKEKAKLEPQSENSPVTKSQPEVVERVQPDAQKAAESLAPADPKVEIRNLRLELQKLQTKLDKETAKMGSMRPPSITAELTRTIAQKMSDIQDKIDALEKQENAAGRTPISELPDNDILKLGVAAGFKASEYRMDLESSRKTLVSRLQDLDDRGLLDRSVLNEGEGPKIVGMGGAIPEEFARGQGSATSIKNATVDSERAKRGLPPAMEPARRSFGQVWDQAMAAVDRDPKVVDALIESLQKKPRALTDFEDALLLHQQLDLHHEYDKATRDLAQAYEDAKQFPEREAQAVEEKLRVARLSDELQSLYDLGKKVGTETGRGLNARKMMAHEDFTLAKMELESRAARGGRQLTDAERAEITALHDKIAESQKRYDEYVAQSQDRISKLEAQAAIDKLKVEAAKEGPAIHPKIIEIAEKLVKQLDARADAARARIKARMGKFNAGVDPTVLLDVADIGASYLGHKVLDFAKWSEAVVGEVGDWVKPHLEEVFKASQKRVDDITEKTGRATEVKKAMNKMPIEEQVKAMADRIAEKKKKGKLDEIKWYAERLGRLFVASGVRDRELLIDKVHEAIAKAIPDQTRDQTMDMMSGYGDYKQLSKDEVSVTYRDLKGQMQQLGKLRDMEARKAPVKSGVERRTPSDEERRLIKQVEEAKRRGGYTVTDPATQLRSALQSMKTRLTNEISDLEFQIKSGTKLVKGERKITPDAEATSLKARRDALKEEFDQAFGKKGITDEQRVANAMRAVEKSIGEYERRIKEGDLSSQKRPSLTPETPELKAAREKRDALREQLQELRDLVNPKKTPEEIALQSMKTRLANSIADLADKLAREDYSPRPKRNVVLDPETTRLRAENERLKKQYAEGNARARLLDRKRSEKALDFVSRFRRFTVLSGAKVLEKLGAYSATRLGVGWAGEGVGNVLSVLPGVREIAARSPSEGKTSLGMLTRATSKAFTAGVMDAWQTARKGESDLKAAYSSRPVMPKDWTDFFQTLHEVLKSPLRRFAFELSRAKRVEHAVKMQVDTSDPMVELAIDKDAYSDSDRALLLENNRLASGIRGLFRQLETPDKFTGRVPVMGKALATLGRVETPILSVPLNFAKQTMQAAFGLVTGSLRARAAFKAGLDDLSPQEADNIMRHLKYGTIGGALLLYGFYDGYKNGANGVFGGYYQPGEKRKEDQAGVGGLKIGGHKISGLLLHNPVLAAGQLGHTMGAIANQRLNKKDPDTKGVPVGVAAGMFGLIHDSPLGRESELLENLSNPRSLPNAMGEHIKGIVDPQLAQEVAQWMDRDANGNLIKRKPVTTLQHVATGIPVVRETVPKAKK